MGVVTLESMNGSFGGEGGLEEHADVGAVVWSPPIVVRRRCESF